MAGHQAPSYAGQDVRPTLPARGWRRLRTADRATRLTLALTVGVAGAGAWLSLESANQPLLGDARGSSLVLIAALLAVAFLATELGPALVEVRDQAYSFSLAGAPLLLGLLYLPPHLLLAIRVGAAMVAFAVQRVRGLKFGYNTAAYLLDAALVLWLTHRLVATPAELTLTTVALCYGALAAVDILMSCLVLVVIWINQGPMSRREAAEVLLPAAVFVVLNTIVAVTCALLVSAGVLGMTLLATYVVVISLSYRAYVVLRRRHLSLQMVQDFIRHGEGTTTVEELCQALLCHVRTQLHAARIELTLLADAGEAGTRFCADDGGVVRRAEHPHGPHDWLLREVVASGTAARLSLRSGADGAHRRWLVEQRIQDALVVPLSLPGVRGTLAALDRVGDNASFTDDDRNLLVTLAGHLSVALHSRRLVERLQHEASHDVLTGLPNRALLTRRMEGELVDTEGACAAVLLLDLNRFKEVNDALGHHVGDQLLQVVGERLLALQPPGATVARLGGDEFAVFLAPSSTAEAEAVALAQEIRTAFIAPIDLSEVTVTTDACIGIAVAQPGQAGTDVMRHADTAMYAAKDETLAWQVYSADLDRGRMQRLALLSDLRKALDEDGLQVHYQPKLDLQLGVVTGVEALLRWTHPTLGPLAPDVFIPLAESSGLIEQLTWSVLSTAVRQCRAWQDAGVRLTVAVNLSARNVNNPDLPEQVAQLLAEVGLPAHQLVLEITESSVMGDPERTVPTLNRLAAIGVTLSLDDFGTGYSSLSYLQRLPVREVKIDRSFVLGLTHPTESHASIALVRSIVGLGRSLDLHIVAEGVETAGVLEQLRGLGCHTVQGYFVGRPAPQAQMLEDLETNGLRSGVGRHSFI